MTRIAAVEERGERNLRGDVMADGNTDRSAPVWAGNLTAAATVLGAFIAMGQSGTAFVKGWSDYKAAEIKARHDLAADDLRNRSSLADSYLNRLLTKDISDPDKLMLLGALSSLKEHPLQRWAADRKAQLETEDNRQLAERQSRVERLEATTPEMASLTILQNRIDAANARLVADRDSPQDSQQIEDEISGYVKEIAQIKAAAGLNMSIARSVEADGGLSVNSTLAKTVDIANKLTAELIIKALPNAPPQNIRRFAPLLIAGLKEFQLLDPKLVSYAIATVAIKAPSFSPTVEPGSDRDLEGRNGMRKDLGNVAEGDGVRFRGRGFLPVTGRSNYLLLSRRLGLGDLLVQYPDIANSPGIASRNLCAFLANNLSSIKSALDKNDAAEAYQLIQPIGNAASSVQTFVQTYKRVLSAL